MKKASRLVRAAALAVTLGALLAGCTARTDVSMTVRSSDAADVQVAVSFTDEAAEVLATDDAAMDELLATFEQRVGAPTEVRREKDVVRLATDVDYEQLTESGAVTGVAAVRLAPSGDNVRATVELRDAPELLTALSSATAGQPDAPALAATMARSTHLVLRITFPGGVAEEPSVVGVSAQALSVDEDTVIVVRSADEASAGAVLVVGDTEPAPNWTWVVVATAAVATALAAAVARRRDEADRQLC